MGSMSTQVPDGEPEKRALVLLNPGARGGSGNRLWTSVKDALGIREGPDAWTCVTHLPDIERAISEAWKNGIRLFIAAGGDGTVHSLLNALLACFERGEVPLYGLRFGGIGLGSSNDFQKPFRRLVAGVPVRISTRSSERRDIGIAQWRRENGTSGRSAFLVSGSLGVVAEANARFNSGKGPVGFFKPLNTDLAILSAAVGALGSFRGIRAWTQEGEKSPERVRLTNLSILKTPFLSGFFRYGFHVPPADGALTFALCRDHGPLRTILLMAFLAAGRFRGPSVSGPGSRTHFSASRFRISSMSEFSVELDGELERAVEVAFSVHPRQLDVCL